MGWLWDKLDCCGIAQRDEGGVIMQYLKHRLDAILTAKYTLVSISGFIETADLFDSSQYDFKIISTGAS